jgi:hypothetical protein
VPSISSDSLVGRLLSSYGAIAAALAAMLYLAGVATLTVRMHKAGLSTHDMLPLFSLDQLLRVGLTWIYPAIPALLGLSVLYVFSIFFERKLGEEAAIFEAQHAGQIPDSERLAWTDSFARLRFSTDWSAIRSEVSKAIGERQDDPNLKQWKRLRWRLTLFGGWTALIGVILLAACFPLSVAVGAGTAIAFILTALLTGTRPAQQALLPIFAVVALGILVNAIVNPRPFPHATVTTDSSTRKTGDLAVISDGTWYLGDGNGGVIAVPLDKIKSSYLKSQPQSESLWEVVTDSI